MVYYLIWERKYLDKMFAKNDVSLLVPENE